MESKTTPKDFFMYLFAAGTLYASATSLVTLLWQLINAWLPDPTAYEYGANDALRVAVSVLVVAFPAYVIAMWHIGRDVDREPGKKDIWVRRWMIWATLFLAAGVLLCDLVTLVYTFLGGEIALRFFMKAIAVGAVAKAVLLYHWFLLKREPGTKLSLRKGIAAAAAIVVTGAIIGAVLITGSPATARAARNDQRRINDLQNIQYQMTTFWQQKQRLPQSLDELVDQAAPNPLPSDPVTGAAYRYEARGKNRYALCATFEAELSEKDAEQSYAYDREPGASSWQHGSGEACFERMIDPERYPPLND